MSLNLSDAISSGFAMAFYILLPLEHAFSSPISAFMKVIVMMLGEFQFEDYIPIEKVGVVSYSH